MPREPLSVPLTRNRDFKVVLGSQGISALGDAVNFTALPLLVLALTGSGFAMGIVGAVQTLPDLLFGMVAGAIADRSDRKRLMLLADLGRAGLTAMIPVSVALGGPTMAVILLVAAPLSILRTFFLAGYTSSLPALVGRSEVGRANSVFETIYSIGYIVGPSMAGVLAATIGPGPTLAIDAVSFAISALGLAFVHRDLRAPLDRPRQPLVADIREGIDYIGAEPDAQERGAVLGCDIGRDGAARDGCDGVCHQGARVRAIGARTDPHGVRGRDGRGRDHQCACRRADEARTRDARRQPRHGARACLVRPELTAGRASRCGRRRRDHSVVGPRHLPDPAHGGVARCAPRADRKHRPDDLAGSPADRPPGGGAFVDATSASLTITVMAIGVAGVSLLFLPAASFRRARLATR